MSRKMKKIIMTIVTVVSNANFLGVNYSTKNKRFGFGWVSLVFDLELSDRCLLWFCKETLQPCFSIAVAR